MLGTSFPSFISQILIFGISMAKKYIFIVFAYISEMSEISGAGQALWRHRDVIRGMLAYFWYTMVHIKHT